MNRTAKTVKIKLQKTNSKLKKENTNEVPNIKELWWLFWKPYINNSFEVIFPNLDWFHEKQHPILSLRYHASLRRKRHHHKSLWAMCYLCDPKSNVEGEWINHIQDGSFQRWSWIVEVRGKETFPQLKIFCISLRMLKLSTAPPLLMEIQKIYKSSETSL